MLPNLPFLGRVARPILKRPVYYLAALGIGGLGTGVIEYSDELIAFYLGVTALFAAFVSMRRVDDDHATDTLVQLDVLPVPRWRMALETAAGAVAGVGVFAVIAAAVSALRVRGYWDWAFLFNQLPVIPAMALLGTIVPLRHRMSLPAMGAMLAVIAIVIRWVAPNVQHALSASRALTAFAMMPVKLAAWLALWAALWKLAHLLGGGWTGGDALRPAQRARDCASACPLSRPTPSGFNPLFWRELKTDRIFLFALWIAGAAYEFSCPVASSKYLSPAGAFTTLLGWTWFGLCMFSAVRTSHDRLSGMWADLAYTPVPLRSVLWSRVQGMAVQSGAMIAGWFLLALVLDTKPVIGLFNEGPVPVLTVLGCYLGAVLAGFASGTSGRGVAAGIGGLILMNLLMVASLVQVAVLGALPVDGGLRQEPAAQAVAFLTAALTFYGTLITISLRAIRRAAEEQRA